MAEPAPSNSNVAEGISQLKTLAADNRLFTTALTATQIQMNIDNKLSTTSDKVSK